jgi:hypothetical protein
MSADRRDSDVVVVGLGAIGSAALSSTPTVAIK